MAETKINQSQIHHVKIGNMDFVVEAVYGSAVLSEILADYTINKVKEENVLDEAA